MRLAQTACPGETPESATTMRLLQTARQVSAATRPKQLAWIHRLRRQTFGGHLEDASRRLLPPTHPPMATR